MLRAPRLACLALGLSGCFVDPGGSGGSGASTGAGSESSASTGAGTSTTDVTTSGSGSTSGGSATTDASASATTGESDGSGATTTDASTSEGSTSEPASTGMTSTSTSTSTTGPLPACGDGVIDPGEGCDDGNLVKGDGCSPTCEREWRVAFVSSVAFDGNLGGLDGADGKCQDLADKAGLPGTFRAWLSSPEGTPNTRFNKWADRYVRVDGAPIAFHYADLVDGSPLLAPLNLSEQGLVVSGATCGTGGVWTATSTAGDFLGEHCSGWKAASKLIGGAKGLVSDVKLWTEASCAGPCEGFGRIYCFQQ